MADIMTKEERRARMRLIRGKDTKPERTVRSLLHRMGYRFRLHRSDLPGAPDIVLSRHRKIILVHGCFWHCHPGCRRATRPAGNKEFWEARLNGNVERDQQNLDRLHALRWRVLVVWECEITEEDGLRWRLMEFLRP